MKPLAVVLCVALAGCSGGGVEPTGTNVTGAFCQQEGVLAKQLDALAQSWKVTRYQNESHYEGSTEVRSCKVTDCSILNHPGSLTASQARNICGWGSVNWL